MSTQFIVIADPSAVTFATKPSIKKHTSKSTWECTLRRSSMFVECVVGNSRRKYRHWQLLDDKLCNIIFTASLFVNFSCSIYLKQGFPTWGTCTPSGTFASLKGTFRVSNRREKLIYVLFISTYISCNKFILRHKNGVYLHSSKLSKSSVNYWVNFCYFTHVVWFWHKKFQVCTLICRNAEGVYGQRKVVTPWSKRIWIFFQQPGIQMQRRGIVALINNLHGGLHNSERSKG